jgi:hypothetical protein
VTPSRTIIKTVPTTHSRLKMPVVMASLGHHRVAKRRTLIRQDAHHEHNRGVRRERD